jgi:hypothetical protein
VLAWDLLESTKAIGGVGNFLRQLDGDLQNIASKRLRIVPYNRLQDTTTEPLIKKGPCAGPLNGPVASLGLGLAPLRGFAQVICYLALGPCAFMPGDTSKHSI